MGKCESRGDDRKVCQGLGKTAWSVKRLPYEYENPSFISLDPCLFFCLKLDMRYKFVISVLETFRALGFVGYEPSLLGEFRASETLSQKQRGGQFPSNNN